MNGLPDVIAASLAELATATGQETPEPLELDEVCQGVDRKAIPA